VGWRVTNNNVIKKMVEWVPLCRTFGAVWVYKKPGIETDI